MDAQAYIINIAVDCNMHPCYIEVSGTDSRLIAMQCVEILKITCGEKFLTNGKVRILIRIEICILHVWTSADPHIRILPPASVSECHEDMRRYFVRIGVTVRVKVSLALSRVFVSLPLPSHTRLKIAACKKLATVRAPRRRPFRKKYTNQWIDNVRQTFARLLLFNTNAPLFVKNDFKITNYSADNAPYPARNCVESIHWAGTVLFHRSGHSQGKI